MKKLADVVRGFMIGQGIEDVDKRFPQYYQLGLEGLEKTTSETAGANFYKKHKKLQVQDNGTVPFPADFVDYLYVGICQGGTMVGLTYSPNMCPPMHDDCGNLTKVDRGGQSWFFPSRDIYERGTSTFEGANGYFKPYYEGGYFVIELNGIEFDSIELVYRSSLFEQDGDYMVFPADEEVIRSYIKYRLQDDNRRAPVSQKQWSRSVFIQEKRLARMKNNPIKPQDILNAIRR